ncbi:hypothetical protein JL721_11224 [Aureococcus anophagefferens]|nr:hypothetical protein JL721_11224 [Aureococcus anophagefferens]
MHVIVRAMIVLSCIVTFAIYEGGRPAPVASAAPENLRALSEWPGGVPPGCEPDAPSTTANGNVTIVTQSTTDRLWNLGHVCERWKGPLSLGMMVTPEDPGGVTQHAKRIMAACPEVHVSVLVREPDQKYPVNRLRNLAWARATTPWIFLLDADFWPGADARFLLEQTIARSSFGPRTALVVPAFALDLGKPAWPRQLVLPDHAELAKRIPLTKRGLVRCLANGTVAGLPPPPRWTPRTLNLWEGDAVGAAAARSRRARTTRAARSTTGPPSPPLPCFLSNQYEPFVAVPRCLDGHPGEASHVPRFDERYMGYGKTRSSGSRLCGREPGREKGANYSFRVVPDAFTVHVPHPRSTAMREWSIEKK